MASKKSIRLPGPILQPLCRVSLAFEKRIVMRRCPLVFSALFSLVASVPLWAAEPHLDFVHGLRSSGKADLALQYLQSKGQGFPPELSAVLPVELAMIRLELAAAQPDAASRAALYDQAQNELETFL